MFNNEILQKIATLKLKEENLDFSKVTKNLDLLEKAHSNLHEILIQARMKNLMSLFGEKDSDIYIISHPKSGTTLTQMIMYQLTTNGNMNFNHIYNVSPWCRFSAFKNIEMPSVGSRRLIKSHDSYKTLGGIKKGKFIFLIRDGLDAIVSLFHHIKDYNNPSVDFKELSNRKLKTWIEYNKEWIENKNQLDILYINYEDLVKKKKNTIRQIANFFEIEIDSKILERVLAKTSFEYMKKNETKFGEQPEKWKVTNNFIRKGKIEQGKLLFTEEQIHSYKSLGKEFFNNNKYISRYFK